MVDDPIPGDVRDYILNHIESIAQMEALLLLRAEPDGDWDVDNIARRIYVSEPEVSEALAGLIQAGVVSFEDNLFRYNPAPDLKDLIERVLNAYQRHLIPVTNLIHSKPRRIQQFADAFRFRKDR